MFKVLKITKEELKEIKENNIKVNCRFLHFAQLVRKK